MKIVKYLTLALMGLLFFTSCEDDDDGTTPMTEDPVASFQFEVDENDFLTVNFSNFSQNASSYNWDFGDGNSSTEESPSHTYDAAGEYEVTLTASNSDGDSQSTSRMVTITDPNEAQALLTGAESKTWKLFREGTCMALYSDTDLSQTFWEGLTNDGSRPCLYQQEFTFHADGTYEFDDNGMFWAEFGVFNGIDDASCTNVTNESCFEAIEANMLNQCGEDVSAWLSGTHNFDYDPSTGSLTLTGEGAWIGIPKLGTTADNNRVPQSSVTTQISIEENDGYDVMKVEFIYGGTYWPIYYASYSDPSLEPELVTEEEDTSVDLDDISPDELFRSFASNDPTEWTLLDTIFSASTVEYGVDDPADPMGAKVGQFNRTEAQFQELQFQTAPDKFDINFENLSTASIEVYLPSSNNYMGNLTRNVAIGFGDVSEDEGNWWMNLIQYRTGGENLPLDTWTTVTFDLTSPDDVPNPADGASPFERNDLDMLFLNIGGSNHTDPGTFYVRNLRVE